MVGLKKNFWIKIFASIYIQLMFLVGFKTLIINFGLDRANYYSESARFLNSAINHYHRILVLDKKNLEALVWLGYAYEDLDKNDEALRCYNLAIKYHSNSDKGYYFKMILFLKLKKYKQVKDLALIGVRLNGKYKKEFEKVLGKM